jgi:DNA-directed RNA polymerase specialized sigma24 family protein
MPSEGSVTHWLGRLQAGDQVAAQKLWERYFQRLAGLARKKLRDIPRRAADEEDVALSAFDSLCRGVARGRFPQLADRDNLWHLLVHITVRKAGQRVRHERRQKRGGGAVLDEAALAAIMPPAADEAHLEQALSREPSPELAAQMAEECQRLLASLGDPELRSLALLKLEGYTNDEIAAQLKRAPRTIHRRLDLIRSLWAKEIGA